MRRGVAQRPPHHPQDDPHEEPQAGGQGTTAEEKRHRLPYRLLPLRPGQHPPQEPHVKEPGHQAHQPPHRQERKPQRQLRQPTGPQEPQGFPPVPRQPPHGQPAKPQDQGQPEHQPHQRQDTRHRGQARRRLHRPLKVAHLKDPRLLGQ